MCGIIGMIGGDVSHSLLNEMVQKISHRGPDDFGIWIDETGEIGLAHARLSILDLSDAGKQPMLSSDGSLMIVFNGEIYNHKSIRAELECFKKRSWKGCSDTETLLEAVLEWGVEAALEKVIGMFAFAVIDIKDKSYTICRDRMGEKPLYYGWIDKSFVFSSELKPYKVLPKFSGVIDRNSLSLYMRYGNVPAPFSIYKGIHKLEPGHLLKGKLGCQELVVEKYWSIESLLLEKNKSSVINSELDAINGLHTVLESAVASQMEADVPLGAFLSGGIDSSIIVSLMQSQSEKSIKTFSIGFDNAMYNEAEHAKMVSKHLKTAHTELYVSDIDALNTIPLLPKIYDEPFSDSSQIPTYLVSKMAKESVTVALSGDAGDELFGGYNRYVFSSDFYSKIDKLPSVLRKGVANGLMSIPEHVWNTSFGKIFKSRYVNIGFKIHKGAEALSSSSLRELHLKLASQINNPNDWVLNSNEYHTALSHPIDIFKGLGDIDKMMAYDLIQYLPSDILVKVDRAAMAASLETRVPFLDLNVIKFSASLPVEYKIRNGVGKWALREVLYKYVPKTLIDRPKMGFGIPLDEWLRGPLREWAETLINAKRLESEGYFNVKVVRRVWEQHLSRKYNYQYKIWNVLMFQSWLEKESN
ncbi:asparagine synthase (glutamine-hydrolyzing) [Cycloclasticus pugetii]|uniref:asparagine synthase (glutamine-hydrolyzing) n=1 Tax=Cycloclasticus pugetii TaxID=34068 RepID=UPI003A8CA47E